VTDPCQTPAPAKLKLMLLWNLLGDDPADVVKLLQA
jgi:hypothetical protein